MDTDGATSGPGGDAAGRKAQGDRLCEKGRFKEAIEAYLGAIDEDSDYSPAYAGLGHVLHASERFEEALVAYREGLLVNPDDIEIHAASAVVLAKMRRFDESLAAQSRAASINPNSSLTHQAMGEILMEKDDPKSAVESFQRAVEIDPNRASPWNHLGTALNSLGRFEEAADCFRHLLALRPNSAMAYCNLVSTGRSVGATEIEGLTRLLQRPDLPVDERIPAGFALGKLLDAAQRYDEAFAHYRQANDLVKSERAAVGDVFDPQVVRAEIDQMERIFTPEFFRERKGWGDPSELPVFVIGMPRSGTTLVQQIAASHPLVHGAGELKDIVEIAKKFGGTDLKSVAMGWNRERITAESRRHLQRLQAMDPAATRVVDKMPRNVYRVALIALLFPGARIIQCRRDARDTCLSCYFQWFATGNLFSYDLADCGHEYLATERMLNHWPKVAPLRILDVQYESLVADLEGQSRRLIDFLGLPWDPACLQFHQTKSAVLTSSMWQVRQPIYQRSVGRWKHYEKHLGPLKQVLEMA